MVSFREWKTMNEAEETGEGGGLKIQLRLDSVDMENAPEE